MRNHQKEIKIKLTKSGATSSQIEAFDQLPYFAILRLANRYGLGEIKHGRGNWRKGLKDKKFILARLGHILKHTLKAIAIEEGFLKDDGDDNAAAIMWGGAFLAESQELRKNDQSTVKRNSRKCIR